MPLTDTSIRNAKPAAKAVKLFDGAGLYVEVAPAGGKWWRLKFRFDGKEKRLSLGVYPEVSLKDARERRDTARKLLACGVDPGANRKAMHSARQDRGANSFEVVAREWHTKYASTWDARHVGTILRCFERDIFPWIGARPIADVSAPDLLCPSCAVLRSAARSRPRTGPQKKRTTTVQTVGMVPPSITYSVPVIEAARGETRKAIRSATSIGLAGRPSGMPPRLFMMIRLPPS